MAAASAATTAARPHACLLARPSALRARARTARAAPRIDFSAETAAPVDVCASAPHGLALPAPASLARKSPPSLKLSPGKGRALFLAQLRAHHDYCQLQQARLAMVEAEQHEALRLRLAGHISPFERACAALASDSAKRFKALHSNAAACARAPCRLAPCRMSRISAFPSPMPCLRARALLGCAASLPPRRARRVGAGRAGRAL